MVLDVAVSRKGTEQEGEDEDQEVFEAVNVSKQLCDAIDLSILDFDLQGEVEEERDDGVFRVVSLINLRD